MTEDLGQMQSVVARHSRTNRSNFDRIQNTTPRRWKITELRITICKIFRRMRGAREEEVERTVVLQS